MPNDALAKIRRAANAIRKARPGMSYQGALKQAGRQYREGKIGRTPKKRKVGAKPRKARYVPVKAEHCKRVGSVEKSIVSTKKKLAAELGWAWVAAQQAKTNKAYNRHMDRVDALKKKIKALS